LTGKDNDHTIALWESCTRDWHDGKLLAWAKGDVQPVLFCAFYDQPQRQTGFSAKDIDFLFATGGRSHQKFWTRTGRCLNAYYPEYEMKQPLGTLLCGVAVANMFVSGSSKGQLFVWRGRKLDRVIKAHELGVTCVWSCPCGLVTASKDGVLKLWTTKIEHVRSFALRDADIPPILSLVRSVDCALSLQGDAIIRILVTTAGGEIYEIAAQSGTYS
jgi:WD40 repeat protein